MPYNAGSASGHRLLPVTDLVEIARDVSFWTPERTSSRRCSERARADIGYPGITTRGAQIMADISPDLFMDAVLAYQQTAAIKAALELPLFGDREG